MRIVNVARGHGADLGLAGPKAGKTADRIEPGWNPKKQGPLPVFQPQLAPERRA
ncbi:hypothetical protein D3C87_2059900 [compost metagenome]